MHRAPGDTRAMTSHRFFGYGSLVNAATHDYPDTRPATLDGWRRVWVHTSARPVAYLSAEPAQAQIDGLTAAVPGGDWDALDLREAAYERHPIATVCGTQAQVYAVPQDPKVPAQPHPILLSYLDVVVQGYAQVFGEDGVARFFATTAGWDSPILDDRAAPRYPRAQPLTEATRALTDHFLDQVSGAA